MICTYTYLVRNYSTMRVNYYIVLIPVIVSYATSINAWKLIKTKTINLSISVESSTLHDSSLFPILTNSTNGTIGLHSDPSEGTTNDPRDTINSTEPNDVDEMEDTTIRSMKAVAAATDITDVTDVTEEDDTANTSVKAVAATTTKAATDITDVTNVKEVDDTGNMSVKAEVAVKATVAVTSEPLAWYPDGFKSGYPNFPNSFISTYHTKDEGQEYPKGRVLRDNHDDTKKKSFLDDIKKSIIQSIPAIAVTLFAIIIFTGLKCLITIIYKKIIA